MSHTAPLILSYEGCFNHRTLFMWDLRALKLNEVTYIRTDMQSRVTGDQQKVYSSQEKRKCTNKEQLNLENKVSSSK